MPSGLLWAGAHQSSAADGRFSPAQHCERQYELHRPAQLGRVNPHSCSRVNWQRLHVVNFLFFLRRGCRISVFLQHPFQHLPFPRRTQFHLAFLLSVTPVVWAETTTPFLLPNLATQHVMSSMQLHFSFMGKIN